MPHSSDGSRLKKDSFHEAYRFVEEDTLEKVVEGLADDALASAAAEVIVDGILEEALEAVCAQCDLLRTATDESIPAQGDSEVKNNTQESPKSIVETDVGDTRGDMIEDINTIISSFNALRVSSDGSLDERPILEDDIKKVISAMSSDFEWKFSSEEVLVTREGQGDVHTTEKVEQEVEVHDGGNQVPQIVSVEDENFIVTVNVLHRMLAELQEDNSEEESTGLTEVKHKTCTNADLDDKVISRTCENESASLTASSQANTLGENGTSLADNISEVFIENGSSGKIKEEKNSNVIGESDGTNKTSQVRLRELPVVAQTNKFCHTYHNCPRDILGKNCPTSECIHLKGKVNSTEDSLLSDLYQSKQSSDAGSKIREKDENSKDYTNTCIMDTGNESNENMMKCYLISTISDESEESYSVSAIAEWEDRNEQEVQIIDPDYDHSQEEGLLHLQPPLHRMEEYPWCYQVSSSDEQHGVGRDPQITKILRNVTRHLRISQQHVKTCRLEGYDVQPDPITSMSVPSTSLEDSSQNRLPVILENNYYYSHEEDIPCIRKFAKSVDVAMSEVMCTYDNDTCNSGTRKDFVNSVTEEYISISDTSLLSTSVFSNSNEKPKILTGQDIFSFISNPKGDSNFEAYNVQSKKCMTNSSSVKEFTEQISDEGRVHKDTILNDPVNENLNNGCTEETKIEAIRDVSTDLAVDSEDDKEIHNVTVAPRIITLTIGPENNPILLDYVEGKENNKCERNIMDIKSDLRDVDSVLISAEKRQIDDDDNVLLECVNKLDTHGDIYKEHIYSTQPTSLSTDQCDQFSVINFEQGLTREDVLLIQSKSPLIQISTDSSDQIILPNYNSIYEGDCVLKMNSHCMTTTTETHHVLKTINTKVAESDIVDNNGDKIYIFDDDHTQSEVNMYCMKMETSNRTIRPNTVQEPVADNSQPQEEVHSSSQSNTIQVTNSHAEHDQPSENRTYSGINYQVVLERTDQNHNSDETQQDLQDETGNTSQQDEQNSSEEHEADVEVSPSLTDSNASTALHDSSTALLTETHNTELPMSAEGGSQLGLDDDGSIRSFEVHGYITSSFDSCDYSSCPDVESHEELEHSDPKEEGINAVEYLETGERISDISMKESSEIFNEYEITKNVEDYDTDEITLIEQISVESLDSEIINQSVGTGVLITELEATPLETKVDSPEREPETSGESTKQLENNNSINIADTGEDKPIPEMANHDSYSETQINASGRERDPDPRTIETEKNPDLTENIINVADIDTDNERSLEQAFSNVTSFEINANRMSQNSSDESNFSRATLCLIDLNSGFMNDYESSGLYDLYDDKSYQIFELSTGNSLTSTDRMDIADRPFPHPVQSSPYDINESRAVGVHVTSTTSAARLSGEYRDTVQAEEIKTVSTDLISQKGLSGENYQRDSIDDANSSERNVAEQGPKNGQSISQKEIASLENDTEQCVLQKIDNVEELSSNQKQIKASGSTGVEQVSQSECEENLGPDIRRGIVETSELEQELKYRQDPLEVIKVKSRSCSEGDSQHPSEQNTSKFPDKLPEPLREQPKGSEEGTVQHDIIHANEILSEPEILVELTEESQGSMNKGTDVDTVREMEERLGQNSKEPNEIAHESSHDNVIHTESNEVHGINEPLSFESHNEVETCKHTTEGTTVSSKVFKNSDHKNLVDQNIAGQSEPYSRAGYETNLARNLKQNSNDETGLIVKEDIEHTVLEGPNPNLGLQQSAVGVSRATDIARALCFEKSLRDLLQLDVKTSTEVMVASDNVEGWRRVGLGVGLFPEDLTIHQTRKENHDPCKLSAQADFAGNLEINSEQYADNISENKIALNCVEDVANLSWQDLNEGSELSKRDSPYYKSAETPEIQDVRETRRSGENIEQTSQTDETNVDGSYVADSTTSSACASDLKVDLIVENEEDIHDTMTIPENITSLKRLTDDIQQRTYWSSVGLITEQHHDELSLDAKDVTPELVQSDPQRLDLKHNGSKVSMGDQLLPDNSTCDHYHEKKKLIEIGELVDEGAVTVHEEIDSLKELGATALPLGACSWEACEETISETTDIENSISVNDKCVDKKNKWKKWKLGGRVRRFFSSKARISEPKLSNVSKK